MQIGIDARAALWYRGSGIGTYTYQLINGMLAADPINQYHFVYPPAKWIKADDEFQLDSGERKNRKFWQDVLQTPDLLEPALDIYHIPQNGIGLPSDCPSRLKVVVTVHDLIPFVLPQTCSKPYLRTALRQLPRIVDRADYIIAVSHCTKRDLVEILGVPVEKIAVIYEAAEPMYSPICKQEAKEQVVEHYGLEEPYILNVGGFSRRKNLLGLVKAFHRVLPKLPPNCKLVIAGGGGGGSYEELHEFVDQRDLADDVLFPGFVPLELMPYLYSGAELFVYPSLYEGFGLPLLEAMACGVPVVAANTSSIPEVAGNAAILFDPYEPQSLPTALINGMKNESTREHLIERGFKQHKRFSWIKTSTETQMVYQSLMQD